MRGHNLSRRRAFRLLGSGPKTARRERAPNCPEIRTRMRTIAAGRRRLGDRRIVLMREREGLTANSRKPRRPCRNEGLAVRQRRGRKRATETRQPVPVPAAPASVDPSTSSRTSSPRAGASPAIVLGPKAGHGSPRPSSATAPATAGRSRPAPRTESGAGSCSQVGRELDAAVRLLVRAGTIVGDNGLPRARSGGTEPTSRLAALTRRGRARPAHHRPRQADRDRWAKPTSGGCATSAGARRRSTASLMPGAPAPRPQPREAAPSAPARRRPCWHGGCPRPPPPAARLPRSPSPTIGHRAAGLSP